MFIDQSCRSIGEKNDDVDYQRELQRKKRRNKRYRLLCNIKQRMIDGKLIKRNGILSCCAKSIPETRSRRDGSTYATGATGEVEVKIINGTDRLGYSGMCRCGSGYICPVCNAILRQVRLQEIQQIIAIMFARGYTLAHMILTARHNRYTDLEIFQSRFAAAERHYKSSRSYRAFRGLLDAEHHIRVVEVTDDHPDSKNKTGWHYHAHILYFVRRDLIDQSQSNVDAIIKRLKNQWVDSLNKYDLSGDRDVAAMIRVVDISDCLDDQQQLNRLAEYVAKAMQYEISALPEKTTKTKTKKDKNRITIWELQEIVLQRDDDALYQRYNQYINAMQGVNFLRCSRGLKQLCGIEQKTDEEAVNEQQAEGETVIRFEKRTFAKIAYNGWQGYILSAGEYAIKNGKCARDAIERLLKLLMFDSVVEIDYNIIDTSTGEVIA